MENLGISVTNEQLNPLVPISDPLIPSSLNFIGTKLDPTITLPLLAPPTFSESPLRVGGISNDSLFLGVSNTSLLKSAGGASDLFPTAPIPEGMGVVQRSAGLGAPGGVTTLDLAAAPQLANSTTTNPQQLTPEVLADLKSAAIARWASLGLSTAEVEKLQGTKLVVDDLASNTLAETQGYTIILDWDASGIGWYVDATPLDNAEFTQQVSATELVANRDSVAFRRVDLLSTLTHEFGHILGLEHSETDALMRKSLPIGERLLPSLETLQAVRQDGFVNDRAQLGSTYRNLVTRDGAIGYWGLDETTGTTITDSSLGNHNGTYLGANSITNGNSLGIKFDGASAVDIPLNSPETNYTYELWFKTTEPNVGISFVNDGGGSRDRHIWLNNGNIGNLLWSYEVIESSGKNYADDRWHYLAVTVQSGVGQKVYVDSELVASGNKGESNFSWDSHLTIGRADSNYFKGSIDEVALYGNVLSQIQIREHYLARNTLDTAAPDLSLTNISIPSISMTWGQSIPISWTVTNQGQSAANLNWSDRVYLSKDSLLDSSDILLNKASIINNSPFEVGSSYSRITNISIPQNIDPNQQWYVLVSVDDGKDIAEVSKTNNIAVQSINVSPQGLVYFNDFESPVGTEWSNGTTNNAYPSLLTQFLGRSNNDGRTLSLNTIPGQNYRLEFDLYVIDTWDGSPITSYSPDYFNVTANGNSVFRQTFSNTTAPQSFRIPDVGDYTKNLVFGSWAGVGDSIYRRIPLTFTATGNTTQLNFFGSGLEVLDNESWGLDNVKIWTNDPNTANPNLVVSNINTTPNLDVNTPLNLTWTVTNQGTGNALNNWFDRVYLSKNTSVDGTAILLGSVSAADLTPLAPNTSYNLTKTFNLPLDTIGDWNILVVADSLNLQPETDESDNTRFTPIHIKTPDLIVSNIIAPTSSPERSSFDLAWTVKNQGDLAAIADWQDSIYLSNDAILDTSDRLLSTYDASGKTPLAAGSSYQATTNITLPERLGAGTRYLIVAADRNSVQVETNNDNNYTAIPIEITVPDLIVESATAPNTIVLGDTATFSWTAKNQGNVNAIQYWYDQVYLCW
jgi:Concanavalin A-like lectin/glucanases superfamily/CARDB/Matrixin